MTREEAIKVIHKMLAYTDLSIRANLNADMVDACHLAIKALEQEPTPKNDLGVDCISRFSAEQLVRKEFCNIPSKIYNKLMVEFDDLPSVTPQEPCDKCEVTFKDDNAVSRLSVKDIIYANAYELEYPDGSSEYVVNRDELFKYLMELPSVTPQEPKTGHWIAVHPLQPNDEGDYMCSECRCGGLVWKPTTYCPNCGAKMEQQGENT